MLKNLAFPFVQKGFKQFGLLRQCLQKTAKDRNLHANVYPLVYPCLPISKGVGKQITYFNA